MHEDRLQLLTLDSSMNKTWLQHGCSMNKTLTAALVQHAERLVAAVQALFKLQEPKAVLKVRKEDLSLIKDVLEPIKSKFTEARAPCILLSLPIVANSDLLNEGV
jgi:hypothetical protein